MNELISKVTTLLRADLASEAAAGFPRLRRIPQTAVIQFIDYFQSLGFPEQQLLLDGVAEYGVAGGFHNNEQEMKLHPGFGPYLQAIQNPSPFFTGWRYLDITLTSKWRSKPPAFLFKGQESGLSMEPRMDLLPEVSKFKLPQESLILKLVDVYIGKLLKTRGLQSEGFHTYTGFLDSRNITFTAHFNPGGRTQTFRWRVRVTGFQYPPGIFQWDMPYERLWCQPCPWNYLTEENAERSIQLLPELVVYLSQLAERIDRLVKGD